MALFPLTQQLLWPKWHIHTHFLNILNSLFPNTWNTCYRTLFCSISNARPAGLFFHSVVFPSPVMGTSHSMKQELCRSTLQHANYLPVVLCQEHALTYMFTALGLHIWCATLLLLLYKTQLPVFLLQLTRQRLLSTQTKYTLHHCITSRRLIWSESLDHKVFVLLCWQVKSPKNKNNLLKRTQCDCSTHYLARRFTCKGLLECVNWYVLCECLFLLSS